MTTHYPRQDYSSKTTNGPERGTGKPPSHSQVAIDLQESLAHLHPLQRQHAIELHRQQQQQQFTSLNQPQPQPKVQASLATFTACTVPASCRARSRFLNLRDSVKKSPAKTTAKVGNRPGIPWVPFDFNKVDLRVKLYLQGIII